MPQVGAGFLAGFASFGAAGIPLAAVGTSYAAAAAVGGLTVAMLATQERGARPEIDANATAETLEAASSTI